MRTNEMTRRRHAAVSFLAKAINELGPITDVTRHAIREPTLDLVERIHKVGKELSLLRFDVYDRTGRLRTK